MGQGLRKYLNKLGTGKYSLEEEKLLDEIAVEKLPRHIAIIMDGNGRWAQKRSLPRTYGHRRGAEALKRVVEFCGQLQIEAVTVYAFSTENWKRPQTEVSLLMELLVEYLEKEIDTINQNNVKIRISGDTRKLPVSAARAVERALDLTEKNDGLTLNIALNYGGRQEIIMAVKEIMSLVNDGEITIENIDTSLFEEYLFTRGLPDPDLLIRTSGEKRLSNFLLWQLAYSELVFLDVLWPDFNRVHLLKALLEFQHRKRRYGSIQEKDGE